MNFDKVINRHKTGSVKWDLTEELCNSQNALPMWVPDMYFDNPEPVYDQDLKIASSLFGISYGQNVNCFMRLNFAVPESVLIDGLNRIRKVFEQ